MDLPMGQRRDIPDVGAGPTARPKKLHWVCATRVESRPRALCQTAHASFWRHVLGCSCCRRGLRRKISALLGALRRSLIAGDSIPMQISARSSDLIPVPSSSVLMDADPHSRGRTFSGSADLQPRGAGRPSASGCADAHGRRGACDSADKAPRGLSGHSGSGRAPGGNWPGPPG